MRVVWRHEGTQNIARGAKLDRLCYDTADWQLVRKADGHVIASNQALRGMESRACGGAYSCVAKFDLEVPGGRACLMAFIHLGVGALEAAREERHVEQRQRGALRGKALPDPCQPLRIARQLDSQRFVVRARRGDELGQLDRPQQARSYPSRKCFARTGEYR